MSHITIYPSVLQSSAHATSKLLGIFSETFAHIQLDFCDGRFVESKTHTIHDLMNNVPQSLQEMVAHNTFELHLMMEDPFENIDDILGLQSFIQIKRAIIHVEIAPSESDFISILKDMNTKITTIPCFNLETNLHDYPNVIQESAALQLMSVHPGSQGTAFQPSVMDSIQTLKNDMDYEGEIILDGGINSETLAHILTYDDLPSTVCPGSYFSQGILELSDPEEARINLRARLEKLQELVSGELPEIEVTER